MAESRKTALVTGAASGIGLACSEWFIQQGYRVVLVDRNDEQGTRLQQKLGDDTIFLQCDVGNWSSQEAMFKTAFQWAGRIDVLLANAGIEEQEPFYDLPDINLEPARPNMAVVDVSLLAVCYSLRLLRYYNQKTKTSTTLVRMIIMSSINGLRPGNVVPVYSAAKHGVSASSKKQRN